MTAEQIGALARDALLQEVLTTPKPGLVDRENNGAHSDMDVRTFTASANSLEPHFAAFARAGMDMARMPEAELFAALRGPGKRAEADMMAATGGVNTHRGALFSLGLLCGAAGRRLALGQSMRAASLCRTVAAMTRGLCARELASKEVQTAGGRVYSKYGAPGARGEAESGFESVRRYALPVLRGAVRRGEDENTARVRALILLISYVTDTNVLARRGPDSAQWLRQRAAEINKSFSLDRVRVLDRQLIDKNISPGGCADLLAVGIFLLAVESAGALTGSHVEEESNG